MYIYIYNVTTQVGWQRLRIYDPPQPAHASSPRADPHRALLDAIARRAGAQHATELGVCVCTYMYL